MKRVLTQPILDLPCVPLVWGGVPGRSGDLITDSLAA
jgi:hypothetical protein